MARATKAQRSLWIDPAGKWGVNCYICKEEIAPKATNWGFTWGSDGFYPDNASAMYCCWNCRAFWIEPPELNNASIASCEA